jgi:hypothetical protein
MRGLAKRLYGYFSPILVNPDEPLALEYDYGPSNSEGSLTGICAHSLQCVAKLAVAKFGLVAILR